MNIEKYDPSVEQPRQEQEVQSPQDAVVVEEKPRKEKKKSNRGWWAALIVLALLILLAVSCPDKQRHKDAINQEVSSAVTNTLVGKVGNWAVMGNLLVTKVVDMVLDSNIDMHNYLVCSVTTAEYNGKQRVLSVGALGNVWVLFDREQLQKVIEQQGTQIWNSLMGNVSEFIGNLTGFVNGGDLTDSQSGPGLWDDEGVTDGDETIVPDSTKQVTKQPKTAEDLIDQAVEDVTSEVGKAVQKGVGKAIDNLLKGLTGD